MSETPTFPNRAVQLEILKKLKESYPGQANVWAWTEENLSAELSYLHEHGLISAQFRTAISEPQPKAISACLTANGVDFLQQDGGLSAILGVVTIKLHDDTIKDLIEAKIMESNLPPPDKKKYADALRELPAETTKHLVMKLVDMGLDHKDAAISAIGKWLGFLG